ncbi:MAG: phage terminase large subunit [Anaerolineae bacterium]|nr:phage terminase large subunit [Anaerolineae bacterium]NIN96290.1 phage terminase large subunit [Anaerolineae bacterium]NIQ79310.1 phage terminase large subunit [Anaerolineae bacterium]
MAKRDHLLDELIHNREARAKLTTPQLNDLLAQLDKALRGTGGVKDLPATPADFAVKYSRGSWMHALHLDYISDRLVKMEKRELRRMLVSLGPRHGKSLMIDRYLPAWWLAKHPKDKIILCGYNQTFARQWGADVRDLILEFGEELNLQVNPDRTAADDWQLTTGGGMISVGYGGSLMGKGADLMILDDVVKSAEEADSEVYREKMWEWFQSSALTRLQPNGVIIGVMTRWHQDDLFGRIIDNYGDQWEIVNIPSLAEENDPLGRAVGEPLWPQFHTDDPTYEIRKNSMSPYWWSALHQGRPTPEGGGLLKRAWWKSYHSLPEQPQQWIQTWDLALKDNETNDYSVGQVWCRKGADCFLVNQVRGHFHIGEVIWHMKNFAVKYPEAVAKLVEDSAMGPALKATLTHEVPGIIPIPVKNASKKARVEAVVPYVMAGNVYLPERVDGTRERWVWDFIEECAQFPKAAFDDQVDCFTQGVTFIQPTGWSEMRKAARDVVPDAPTAKEIRGKDFFKWVRKGKKSVTKTHQELEQRRSIIPLQRTPRW